MRVLLATDGSAQARTATQWLMTFPLPPATEVLVVAAVEPVPPILDVPVPPAILDTARAGAQKAADAAVATLRARWPQVSARVVDGDPRRAIPATAEDVRADLVVLGARGLGPWRRLLLGSVSLAVVQHAPCAVLVVRGRPRELASAVVAVDGSRHSRTAAEFFAALPRDPASTVRLIGVVDRPQTPGQSRHLRALIERLAEQQRVELDKTLREVALGFEATTTTVECAVSVGSPVGDILAAAKSADLVVVGARGLGPVERMVVGSVSERVLAHAPCSVLVVKQPGRA